MGVSWVTLMMLGTFAHAQPTPAAHRPDRVAPTPSAPTHEAGAVMPFGPTGPMADGVAQLRPHVPDTRTATPPVAPLLLLPADEHASTAFVKATAQAKPTTITPPSGHASAGPPAERDVRVLAAGCANCHGPVGHSPEGIPPLSGLPLDYLRQRLNAFKTGKAPDATVMTRLLASLDAAELEALAQWFARQPQPAKGQAFPSRGAP